jgi:hypothetical protein
MTDTLAAVTVWSSPSVPRGTLLLMPRDALSLEPMLPNEAFEYWIGRVMAKHGSKFVVVRGIGEP